MTPLLDVNVLLALGHVAHPDHAKTGRWFAAQASSDSFATCSITEIGFLRVSLNARLVADLAEVKIVLAGLLSSPRFLRLGDDVGFDALPAYVTKAADITDGHLLALAQRYRARRCLRNKPTLREAEAMLGQGDRGGGGPEVRAAEGNAGPAWFPSHPQGASKAPGYFEDSA